MKKTVEGALDESSISKGNREVAQKALDYLFKVAQEHGGSISAKGQDGNPGKELSAKEAFEALNRGESVLLKAGKDAPLTEIHSFGELASTYGEVLKAVGMEAVDQGLDTVKSEAQKKIDEYLKKMGITDGQKETGQKVLDYLSQAARERGGAFYTRGDNDPSRKELPPSEAYATLMKGQPIYFQAAKDAPTREIRTTRQLLDTYREVIAATVGDEVKKGEENLGDLLRKKLDDLMGKTPEAQPQGQSQDPAPTADKK
jgi:hypothetical protein